MSRSGEEQKAPMSRSGEEQKAPMSRSGEEQKAPMSRSGEEQKAACSRRLPPRTATLLLELLEDPLALGAHRRTRLGGLRNRKHLATQGDDVRPHHGAFGDLVLLHIVEVLRGVAVGPVV